MAQSTSSNNIEQLSSEQSSNLIFYKLIDSASFSFEFFHNKINPKQISDWSAFYFQLSIRHALYYASQKYETSDKLCLLKFQFKTNFSPIIYKLTDKQYSLASITGKEKAQKIKQELKLDTNKLLMPNFSSCLILLDMEENYELIIPHNLFNENNIQYKEIIEFKNDNYCNDQFATSHWRTIGNEKWISTSIEEKLNIEKLLQNEEFNKSINDNSTGNANV